MNVFLDFVNVQKTYECLCNSISEIFAFCDEYYDCLNRSICVCVSGGSDSLALLYLLERWTREHDVKLFCVTVDHQLREDSSGEAEFVKCICNNIGVTHETIVWNHDENIPHSKIENLARSARYSLVSDFCLRKNISIVMTAHNWNDEIETYEMRKSFNSAHIGLAGISRVRSLTDKILLIRPVLNFSKQHLRDFLSSNNIRWKEDPMNEEERFLRVSYRKRINSYSREKIESISNELMVLRNNRLLIEKDAVSFIQLCCQISDYGFVTIDKDSYLNLDDHCKQEVLKRLIWNIGGKLYAPSITYEVLQQVLFGRINTIGRCLIKIKKNEINIFRESRGLPTVSVSMNDKCLVWDNRFYLFFHNSGDYIVGSSSEDVDNIPRYARLGYPRVFKNIDDETVYVDKSCYNVTFRNKINLYDVFL